MFEFGETGIALTAGEIGYAQLLVVAVLLATLAATGWMAIAASAETRLATGLRAARAALRLESLPMPLFVLALLLWAAVTLVLVAGLFALIGSVLFSETPPSGEEGRPILWEFRFKLAQLAVLTTVLGALVALPITLNRLKLAREANETAKDTLFNTQITEAAADLHAQRQVTRRYADGRLRDEYEDDVIRRNAAIDRLEGLVGERPAAAERVARLLSTYVREMSREYPPQEIPKTNGVIAIRKWARSLRASRSDMENAVRVLGRLRHIAQPTTNYFPIDLREANLQGLRLAFLDFRGADLEGAAMQGTVFAHTNLERASLRGARMQDAFFNWAKLSGANLGRSFCEGANFSHAQMHGANLNEASLNEAILHKADLQYAYLNEVSFVDSSFSGANLFCANLAGAQLDGARMQRVNLVGALLTGASMNQETKLDGADFYAAAVRHVNEETVKKLEPFWQVIFADGSVSTASVDRPKHWASEELGYDLVDGSLEDRFHDRWRAWQRSIGFDPDNPA